jgi:hypothetical protein
MWHGYNALLLGLGVIIRRVMVWRVIFAEHDNIPSMFLLAA